jgi:hypothetical protein
MKTVRMKIDVNNPNATPAGRIDAKRVEATTKVVIAQHQAEAALAACTDAG